MHKENFIYDVSLEIENDIIDIHLLDDKGEVINKETLSKGEQQLYATALLKSLVDESGIRFPVFIDSPLQKFDKEHSKNIISEFYPSISEQVVIFPLLEKELTFKEYSLLRKNINQTFKIKNIKGKSLIEECNPDELFIDIEKKQDVHAY
jgi:DNA sulfur modification protein DndD